MILYTDIVSPDDLPELGSDLVAALAGLDVDDLSHLGLLVLKSLENKLGLIKDQTLTKTTKKGSYQ